jgi:hypothetical protein
MKKFFVHLQSWYGCYTLLFLLIITSILWSWRGSGRYQLCDSSEHTIVLDTKTSQLWLRTPIVNLNYGTNEKPKFERIEGKDNEQRKVKAFEDIPAKKPQ